MMNVYVKITFVCWLILYVYWVAMVIGNKKTARRQSYVKRSIVSCVLLSSFMLLYAPGWSNSWLGAPLAPESPLIAGAGVVICALGLLFAVWARRTLGANWSGTVAIKENHELIVTGPYALVRHPIYTGFPLGFLGAGLALGEVRGVAAFILGLAAFAVKIQEEERFMRAQFPETYPAYAARVRRLVPFIF
jgi:protein-S-isoprenylcysteine O-methyltransferase Ste14